MTGKASLTLCDADSGRVIKRLEESNMVTNAIRNIMDIPFSSLLCSGVSSSLLSGMLPIRKNILGGIMLLGNTLEEDADKIMLPSDFVPVATAGDSYAGSSTMRGSLNENESYATDNGYHFTWDFATDKANGEIKSIALTSRAFGNSGFDPSVFADGSSYFGIASSFASGGSRPNVISIGSYSGGDTTNPATTTNCCVGSFEKNTYLFIMPYANDKSKITLYKYKAVDIDNVLLNDTVPSPPTRIQSVDIELPFTLYSVWVASSRIFYDPDKKLLYLFSGSVDNYDENKTRIGSLVKYIAIDPINLTVEESGSVPMTYTPAIGGAAIYKDKFYVHAHYRIDIMTLSGELIKSIPSSLSESAPNYAYYGYNFYLCDGTLMVRNQNSSIYSGEIVQYPDNESTPCIKGISGYGLHDVNLKLPYMLCGSGMGNPSLHLWSNYLATINNLSEPITKTNSQTLKISYDITN
jgi:hypothetical protein